MHPFRNYKGFTLIELLVVIAIIGILASIVMVSLVSAREKARDAKRVADIKNIQLALETYYNDNLRYTTAVTQVAPTYMSVVPKDPLTNLDYKYANTSTSCNAYHLGAILEQSANTALLQDVDKADTTQTCTGSDGDFEGLSSACSGSTPGTTDLCYDVTN